MSEKKKPDLEDEWDGPYERPEPHPPKRYPTTWLVTKDKQRVEAEKVPTVNPGPGQPRFKVVPIAKQAKASSKKGEE